MATHPDPEAAAPKHELAAIMFSDIAGYTAIIGPDEGVSARNSESGEKYRVLGFTAIVFSTCLNTCVP